MTEQYTDVVAVLNVRASMLINMENPTDLQRALYDIFPHLEFYEIAHPGYFDKYHRKVLEEIAYNIIPTFEKALDNMAKRIRDPSAYSVKVENKVYVIRIFPI